MPLPPESPPAGASPGATKGQDDAIGMSDLVSLYMQQHGAVNQLWAMFAATTFAAGLFAFNVGGTDESRWMLVPGAIGFLFFTVGHFFMVSYALKRLNLVASDIDARLKPECPAAVRALAGHRVSLFGARVVHIGIDICVLAAFAMRFGWPVAA